MAATLKLVRGNTADLDLSAYLNVQEGEGLDPAAGGFLEPAFNDSPIGAGQSLVNIDAQNKEHIYPLMLKAATKDALHTLVGSIRLKLSEPQVRVEWRDQGATFSTFYDLEFGRFEPSYRFFRARQNWLGGNLHLWVRPYGHTGTERIAGTAAGSRMMQIVSVPSAIIGDTGALMVTDIAIASSVTKDVWGLSIIPSGAIVEWPAASLLQSSATSALTGASGANASQYRGLYAGAGGETTIVDVVFNQASRVGDQRVFALARTANLAGAILRLYDDSGVGLGTTLLPATYPYGNAVPGPAASVWRGWQLVDLGVLSLPVASMRVDPTMSFSITADISASYFAGSLMASPGVHLSAVYVLPEDKTSMLVEHPRGLRSDGVRFDGTINETYPLDGTARRMTGYQRGAFQAVSAGEQVAVFAVDEAVSNPQSAVVRVREQFSFQR